LEVDLLFEYADQTILNTGGYDEQVGKFAIGEAAFLHQGNWTDSSYADSTFDMGYLPHAAAAGENDSIFIGAPSYYVVNKDSNEPIALKFRERPDLLIICQPNENQMLLREAFSLQIPVLAFVDSNTCLDYITYPIPVNTENHDWMYYCLDLLSRIANCFSSSK